MNPSGFVASVVYTSVFGRSVFVLNSAKAAHDLLEKWSSIYSDRPRLTMAGDLMGWGHSLPMISYHALFRGRGGLQRGCWGRELQVFFGGGGVCVRGRVLDIPEQLLAHMRQ